MERHTDPVERTRGSGWSLAEWLLGIVGTIALFLGFFVMFADEDQYIGLGGDLSWRVGDITGGWMYGFLVAGGIMLVGALTLAIAGRKRTRVDSSPLMDLTTHAGIFLVVNAFIWAQDIVLGDGLDYAFWVTIPWAIGLLAHFATYLARRRTEATVAESNEVAQEVELKELQPH